MSLGGYVNPFAGHDSGTGRIDMGIDLAPLRQERVVALGDAKVLGSDSSSSRPGGHFIWYRLLDGDHAGNIVYVAEHLTKMVPAGKVSSRGRSDSHRPPRLPLDRVGLGHPGGLDPCGPLLPGGHGDKLGAGDGPLPEIVGGRLHCSSHSRPELAHGQAVLSPAGIRGGRAKRPRQDSNLRHPA